MAKTLQDLLVDKKFTEELFKQETEEDVRELFSSEGVEITDEDLENLKILFAEIADKVKDMDEDELKNVAGGNLGDNLKNDFVNKNVGITTALGALTGAVIGFGNARNLKDGEGKDVSTGKKILKVVASALAGAGLLALGGAGVTHGGWWGK